MALASCGASYGWLEYPSPFSSPDSYSGTGTWKATRTGSPAFTWVSGCGTAMGTRATVLNVTTEDGVPKGVEAKAWDKAFGIAEMSMGNDGNDTIMVEVSGLVPNGLYTLWWVNMKPSMTMGPAAKVPDNQFKTDAHGNASVTFKVPSKNDYQTLFVAFHADGKTHGEDPGKMGVETFSQLMGAFPGPAGMSPDMGMESMATMAPTQAK